MADTTISRLKSGVGEAAMKVFDTKLTRQMAVNMHACVHCGMCFESCHYYLATGDPKVTPAYKAEQLRGLYKRRYDWLGRLAPGWVHATQPTDEQVAALYEAAYGNCTMCRRCNLNCPMGLDMALMMRTARWMLNSQGLIPPGLKATVDAHLATGNNMGISREDFLDTVEWLEEELQKELDDPDYRIPVDQPGTEYLICLNPREVKWYPLLFMAQFKTCYAAGLNVGLSSAYWDATNYGLFSGDDAACKQIVTNTIEEAVRLKAKTLILTECGHGYRVYRWEAPGWYGKPMPVNVVSYIELTAEQIRQGRIRVDKTRNIERVTYHDPCNQARNGGIIDEPRYILSKVVMDFQEMEPHGVNNFCRGGGGGALTMSEFRSRRLAAAKVKADQITATGAKIVATSCHNCIDQMSEVSRHYKLGVKVLNLCELVAEAIVLPPKEKMVTAHEITAQPIEVDAEGFIRDPSQWSPEAAVFLARRQGFGDALEQLTPEHWRVIEFTRAYYGRYGLPPMREVICQEQNLSKKRFLALFPGTLKTLYKTAGLPHEVVEQAMPKEAPRA
ncbi:MAG: TusE/DsrC/DsvC family sulfur relay protein [Dehalococcoidales bacterium]|nr:TusE/DsrC/DsvC family sulfur relay protein [Dehalococcoidales bacterium]